MVLLVLAGLFTQSLVNIARVDLGMTVDSLLTFNVSPGLNSYGPERNTAIHARIQEELAAVPGSPALHRRGRNWLQTSAARFPCGRRASRTPTSQWFNSTW